MSLSIFLLSADCPILYNLVTNVFRNYLAMAHPPITKREHLQRNSRVAKERNCAPETLLTSLGRASDTITFICISINLSVGFFSVFRRAIILWS